MKPRKAHKILLIIAAGFLLLELPWFFVAQLIANRTMTKTEATVIKIVTLDSGCPDAPGRRQNYLCDHSDRQYPVYEYFDKSGKRYEQDDRFFGEYKERNPLRILFWKDIGDKVTAYYTNDKPQEVLFMAGPAAYTAWIIPLYLAIPVFIVAVVFYIKNKLSK